MNLPGAVAIAFYITQLRIVSSVLVYQHEQNFSKDTVMVEAVVSILKHFFNNKILYVSNHAANKSGLIRQNNLLSNILIHVDESTWYLETMQQVPSVNVKYNNIIFIDSYAAFRILYKDLTNEKKYDASGFYLIILTGQKTLSYSIMKKMFSDCWSLFIVNIYIIVSSLDNQILLYSYFPYQKEECGSTVPQVVNRFENSSFVYRFVYHSKASNLHQCRLNVATWHNPPFVLLKKKDNDSIFFSGIEGKLLQTVAMQLNFTLGLIEAPKVNPRGYIFDNGSMTGSFEMLRRGDANLSIGCFRYSEKRTRNFASTHPYFQVPIVVALSRGLSFTALERLLYPLSGSIWIGLLALYGSSVLVISILRYLGKPQAESFIFGPNNSTPIYNMWTSFLGGQINYSSKRNFARFILTLWLIFALVIRGSYQGELYSFLRLNTDEKMPNGFADLVKGDFRIHVDPPTEDIIQINNYLKQVCRISTEPQHDFLRRLQRGMKRAGILCPLAYVSYANSISFGKEPLYIIKERVLVQPNCIYFQKSSPLAKPISQLIWQYSANGMWSRWVDEFASKMRSRRGKPLMPKQFTNKNLAGAYEVYAVLIAISCLVFITEILSVYSAKLRRLFG